MSNNLLTRIANQKQELHALTLDGKIYNLNKVYKAFFTDPHGSETRRSLDIIRPFHHSSLNSTWRNNVIENIRVTQSLRATLRDERAKMSAAQKLVFDHIPSKRVRRLLCPVWETPKPMRSAASKNIDKVGIYYTYINHTEKTPSHIIIPKTDLVYMADYIQTRQTCKTAIIAAEELTANDLEDYEVYKVAVLKKQKDSTELHIEHLYAAILNPPYPEQKDRAVAEIVVYAKKRENLDQRLSTKANSMLKNYYSYTDNYWQYLRFVEELGRQIHYNEFKIAIQTIINVLDPLSYEYNIAINALKSSVSE